MGCSIARLRARHNPRLLAPTAASWHTDHTGLAVKRSLPAADHRPLELVNYLPVPSRRSVVQAGRAAGISPAAPSELVLPEDRASLVED